MPVLRKKIVREIDEIIEENNETTQKTETVQITPLGTYLICDKCEKELIVKLDNNVTIECNQCGCPTFHTPHKFSAECVNCGNVQEANQRFYGYCKKCNSKLWKIL